MVPDDAAERVVLHNNLTVESDLGMWSVRDADGDRVPIPPDVKIPAGKNLTVYTGAGTSTSTTLYAGLGKPVLEPGERVWLLDSGGNVVSCYPQVSPCPPVPSASPGR